MCFVKNSPNGCVIKITVNTEIIKVSNGTRKFFNISGIIFFRPLSKKATIIPVIRAINIPPVSGK